MRRTQIYLDPDQIDELAWFRAALDAANERPLDLPDGQRYVEALRAAGRDRDEELDARGAGHKRPKKRSL